MAGWEGFEPMTFNLDGYFSADIRL